MRICRRPCALLLCTLVINGCARKPIETTRAVGGSGRVEDTRFVPIGGIEQWISVRGADRHNPVILVVHGGPGEAQWPAAAKYQPWERDFVVVQWDQRGAGRTFGRNGTQTPDVNLDRIARDGIEVAEYLCRTLDKKKIIVLGHSWGSIVAIHMVQRRPELFAAYVGTGQVASWKASVQAQFDVLLAKARADNDTAGLRELEAIGRPDPSNARQYFQFTKGLGAVMPAPDQEWLKSLRASTPASLGVDDKDFQDLGAGMTFTGPRVLPDQMATDLLTTATDIHTAFFVIQGSDDVTTPTAAAIAYFNKVQAPTKALVVLDGAGHFAFMTHHREFLAALTDRVRPVAISRGA
jgi:pimeloyl-ACP methyl ester carboxylesterase